MTAAASGELIRAVQVVIGVDTHQDQHVAIAIDQQGVRLAEHHAPATSSGYGELERWSQNLGEVRAFGVEGTGSYGAGLARFLTGRGFTVFEVNRPDRSVRYRKGKSDPTDAEMAARAVIAGVADATPKSGEGEVEMLRMLKSAKDSAVKARTQAVNQMRALVVTAPAALRETLDGLTATALAAPMQELPPGASRKPHSSGQVHSSIPCLPLPPTKQGDPRTAGPTRTTRRDGKSSPGQHLWRRTRHGGNSADLCRQQPTTPALRGCLRFAVRGESDSCVLRQDQPASTEPRWRPPGQRSSPSYRPG